MVDSEFLDLIYDSALKSFWRIKALKRFLSSIGISDAFLTGNGEKERKRDVLDRVFEKLRKHPKGPAVFEAMATSLSERTEFPDLQNWEDSDDKIREATLAKLKLRKYLKRREDKRKDEKEQAAARERDAKRREEIAARNNSLSKLEHRFNELANKIGTAAGGYEFQEWFYDLLDFYEIQCRRPYTVDGRQIDGSVTVSGTTYLVELKFTQAQIGATDVDSLFRKVETKADNTMGILVSVAGYSSVAVKEASRAKTVLLLLDHGHLIAALRGTVDLVDVIERVRRHASQTGEAFLPIQEFGG